MRNGDGQQGYGDKQKFPWSFLFNSEIRESVSETYYLNAPNAKQKDGCCVVLFCCYCFDTFSKGCDCCIVSLTIYV